MQILQGMDPDKMIIVLPTALIAMYLIITLQKVLCERRNPHIGLILPAVCFIASTVLAVRPLLVAEPGEFDGLVLFCIRMWFTFNIATLVFLFPYYKHRKIARAAAEQQLKDGQADSMEDGQADSEGSENADGEKCGQADSQKGRQADSQKGRQAD